MNHVSQYQLSQAAHGLNRLTAERVTSAALDVMRERNQHHREIIAQKVEEYCAVRHRTAYLHEQNIALAQQLSKDRETLKDAKRQLSREASVLRKNRRVQTKSINDLRLEIARLNQRIQRRIRCVRTL